MPDQSTLTSVEEYLNTSYPEGDREYVDGHIVERNLGEKPHYFFRFRRKTLGTFSFVEQRVQVKQNRFRIPDVVSGQRMVTPATPFRAATVRERSFRNTRPYFGNDVLSESSREARDGVLRTQNPGIEMPLSEIFTEEIR